MAISLIQHLPASFVSTTSPWTLTFGSSSTAGNVIIVSALWGTSGSTSASTPTDGGDTFTSLRLDDYSASQGHRMQTWASSVGVSGTKTVSISFTNAVAGVLFIAEFSGASATADGSGTTATSTTSAITSTISLGTAGDLVWGFAGNNNNGRTVVAGTGLSYTVIDTESIASTRFGGVEWAVSAGSGSQTVDATITGGTATWAIQAVALTPSASTGAVNQLGILGVG